MAYFYESGAVEVVWASTEGTVDLSEGWGEGTFLTIAPNSARVETSAGADGVYTFSKIADKGATLTMTFKDVAPVNKRLAAIAAKQDVIGASLPYGAFAVVDKTGDSVSFYTGMGVLTEIPEVSFDRVSGERTWTWVCESYIMTDVVSTVTGALSDYVKQSTNI